MIILWFLLVLAVSLTAVMFLRAYRFQPPKRLPVSPEEIPVDKDKAVRHLQEMIRCRTVSTPEYRDEAEFQKFRALLPEFYPLLFKAATAERVDTTGVILHLRGTGGGDPAVFLSHYDVVPADESKWEKPPFAGILEDGVLWGRGTLDMKNQLCCMLEAIELLLSQGFVPENDIYFCLSGEEEMMGPSAVSMRDTLTARGVHPAFVMDEGGDIMDGFFPGADIPCAMVGIGEKGAANLYFVAESNGGHASVPVKNNPLPRLCRAMNRIEAHPFPTKPGRALERMVNTMGRYTSFRQRFLFANRRLLRPLYHRWLHKTGGMIEAASRTTFALTQAAGSQAGNVIPSEARMFANMRLMWGSSVDSTVKSLSAIIADPAVRIEVISGNDPRPDSLMTAGYDKIKAAIEATWPDAVVSPYLMVACTDSRHWRDVCDNVYRFSGKYVTGAEKATVHGNNERIRTENTENAVKFFFRLLREC